MSIPARLWLPISFLLFAVFPAAGDPPARVDCYGDPLPPGAIARFGTVRWRVGQRCTLLAFAPDGKTVISADAVQGVVVWETATGQRLREFGRFPGNFLAAAVSRDGRLAALAGEIPKSGDTNLYCVWDVSTGKVVSRFTEKGLPAIGNVIGALAFSPDGAMLAVRHFGSSGVTLWDVRTGKRMRQLGRLFNPREWHGMISPAPHTLAFTADGKSIVAAGEYQEACTWDLATGKATFRRQPVRARRRPHPLPPRTRPRPLLLRPDLLVRGEVGVLALSPDGRQLAWFADSALRLGNIHWKGRQLARFDKRAGSLQDCLAFSADGKLLAVSLSAGAIEVWELPAKRKVLQAACDELFHPTALAFSPDRRTLAAVDGVAIRLWDVPSGREISPERGHRQTVWAAALSPDGEILGSYGLDYTLRLWDAATGRVRLTRQTRAGVYWAGSLVFSPNGRTFSFVDGQGRLGLFDARSGRLRQALVPRLRQTELGANAVGRLGAPSLLGLPETPAALAGLFAGPEPIGEVVGFSSDGKCLSTVQPSGFLYDWDLDSGRQVHRHLMKPWGILAASHRGRRFATVSRNKHGETIHLWDQHRERELCRFELPLRRTFGWAFFPDGQSLAVATDLGYVPEKPKRIALIHLVEVHTGQVRRRFEGPAEFIRELAVSPDGRLLASAADGRMDGSERDGRVRLWDVARGQQLADFMAHPGGIGCLFFSQDGRRLVTCGSDSTALLWDVAALVKPRQAAPTGPLASHDLERLWSDLAGADAPRAFDALLLLAGDPAGSLPVLRRHLRPAPRLDAKKIAGWMRDLGNANYRTREQATRALEELGELADGSLRQALRVQLPLEHRRRLELLLQKLDQPALSPGQIGPLRAVEILQRIANPEALRLLEMLATGAPEARLTHEASSALARLKGRR
jgi:WD40 repeat protein